MKEFPDSCSNAVLPIATQICGDYSKLMNLDINAYTKYGNNCLQIYEYDITKDHTHFTLIIEV